MNTLSHIPHLTPDQPPKWYLDIHKCTKCDAQYAIINGVCVLTQDREVGATRWYNIHIGVSDSLWNMYTRGAK